MCLVHTLSLYIGFASKTMGSIINKHNKRTATVMRTKMRTKNKSYEIKIYAYKNDTIQKCIITLTIIEKVSKIK